MGPARGLRFCFLFLISWSPCLGHPDIRLVNSPRESAGRVEVKVSDVWGTVCDDSFETLDALVVCRMLGYTREPMNPKVYASAFYGRGSDKIWLDEVSCNGSESSILFCKHLGLGTHDCSHGEDVAVDCLPPQFITAGPKGASISGQENLIVDGSKRLNLTCTAFDFVPSVSYTWSGVLCVHSPAQHTNTCSFTPSRDDDKKTIICKATNTENWALSATHSYRLSLKYPPSSKPEIHGLSSLESLVEGSNVTLTCRIHGGNPLVTSVNFNCPESILYFPATQTTRDNVVSKDITITGLQRNDNGTECICDGVWEPDRQLYKQQTPVGLQVFADAEPSVSNLTLSDVEYSLTVTAGDNKAAVLKCSAWGRPKPTIRVERMDTGHLLERYTRAGGRDEVVLQYTLTGSAICQNAAIYTCLAQNRAGTAQRNVTLFVNCAPEFPGGHDLGSPENPVTIKVPDASDTPTSVFNLTAYPPPTLKRMVFINRRLNVSDANAFEGQEVDSDTFRLLCEPTHAIYLCRCQITAVADADVEPGFYMMTIGNGYGNVTLWLEAEEAAADVVTTAQPTRHHDVTCLDNRMSFSIPFPGNLPRAATLSDPRCHVDTAGGNLMGSINLNSCGTTVAFTNDSVIFRNVITITSADNSTGEEGLIPIQCKYDRFATVQLSYMPVVRHVLFTEVGIGQLSFRIQQFRDASYLTAVADSQYPLRMEPNERVYIQLSLGDVLSAGHKDDIGINVQECVASPFSTLLQAQSNSVPLIQESCPASNDVQLMTIYPEDIQRVRFSFKVVSFPDLQNQPGDFGLVFVHCRVSVCPADECSASNRTCPDPSAIRRVRRSAHDSVSTHQLSTGPFLVSEDKGGAVSSTTALAAVSMVVAAIATVVAMVAVVAWRRSRREAIGQKC